MDGDDSPGGRGAHHEPQEGARTVLISDEQPHPVDTDRLRRLAVHVLAQQVVPPGFELSVACVDAAEMATLMGRHLDEHAPTDVLAFPMDAADAHGGGEAMVLGDVVLCPAVAADQAAAREAPLADELDLLLVHGILHLLGYDHVDATEQAEMFGLTDTLLASFRSRAT